ncbi:MAG: 2-oxoacid:acceptor oxidoreductase family protein, partial [Candidatus Omnitrophica bacterium]|nr:2-oxoacid:acceptor oxidoreductase family protein [Candidatus Omnitrophota bacterium]
SGKPRSTCDSSGRYSSAAKSKKRYPGRNTRSRSWILWNSSLINPEKEHRTKSIGIPASELAEKLGDIRIANMIMLGGLAKILESEGFPAKEKDFKNGIKEIIGDDKKSLNNRALLEGIRIVEQVMQNVRPVI